MYFELKSKNFKIALVSILILSVISSQCLAYFPPIGNLSCRTFLGKFQFKPDVDIPDDGPITEKIRPNWRTPQIALQQKDKIARTHIRQFFPETTEQELVPGQVAKAAKITGQERDVFLSYLRAYLRLTKWSRNFPEKDFEKWLLTKAHSPFTGLDPFQVESIYKANDFTFEQCFEHLVRQYEVETLRVPGRLWLLMQVSPDSKVYRISLRTKIIVAWLLSVTVWGSLRFRTIPDMWANYTALIFNPPNQIVSQLGAKHFGQLTVKEYRLINKILTTDTDPTRKDARKEGLKGLQELTDHMRTLNFNGMSADEINAVWSAIKDRSLAFSNRFRQGLPGDFAGGRNNYKDFGFVGPQDLAFKIATLQSDYNNDEKLLKDLESEISNSLDKPTPEQTERLNRYKMNLTLTRKTTVSLMVSYQIHRLVFPEAARAATSGDAKVIDHLVMDIFDRAATYMGLPDLIPIYADEMSKALHEIDPELPYPDKIVGTVK